MPPDQAEDPNAALNRLLDFHADMKEQIEFNATQETLMKVTQQSVVEIWTELKIQGKDITALKIKVAVWGALAGLVGGAFPLAIQLLIYFLKKGV